MLGLVGVPSSWPLRDDERPLSFRGLLSASDPKGDSRGLGKQSFTAPPDNTKAAVRYSEVPLLRERQLSSNFRRSPKRFDRQVVAGSGDWRLRNTNGRLRRGAVSSCLPERWHSARGTLSAAGARARVTKRPSEVVAVACVGPVGRTVGFGAGVEDHGGDARTDLSFGTDVGA